MHHVIFSFSLQDVYNIMMVLIPDGISDPLTLSGSCIWMEARRNFIYHNCSYFQKQNKIFITYYHIVR